MPLLSKAAKIILSIPAQSASSERIFSRLKLVILKTRTSLNRNRASLLVTHACRFNLAIRNESLKEFQMNSFKEFGDLNKIPDNMLILPEIEIQNELEEVEMEELNQEYNVDEEASFDNQTNDENAAKRPRLTLNLNRLANISNSNNNDNNTNNDISVIDSENDT